MQFKPKLLKNAASASWKKYSRNWNSKLVMTKRRGSTIMSYLVEEEIRLRLPQDFDHSFTNLLFVTRVP
jgi:hypothetical protein